MINNLLLGLSHCEALNIVDGILGDAGEAPFTGTSLTSSELPSNVVWPTPACSQTGLDMVVVGTEALKMSGFG